MDRAGDTMAEFADVEALIAYLRRWADQPSAEAAGLSELDHGLQCAAELAARAPDDVALQVAGLLHDIGHGVSHVARHDRAGAAAIAPLMGPRIAALVGLHIAAKRYLVTTDPAYRAVLSPLSTHTLALQGGDMDAAELADFEAQPDWREALLLRRADEAAKTIGRAVPGLDHWEPALRALAR